MGFENIFAAYEINIVFQKATTLPPIFLFVVDTCLPEEELKSLKESLQKAISYLPADALIGLITYGRMVEVHELNVKGIPRSFVFKVSKRLIFFKDIGFAIHDELMGGS